MTTCPAVNPADLAEKLCTRDGWKVLGFRVPTKAQPAVVEKYLVPRYRTVYRNRHLFSFDQVVPLDPVENERRCAAAKKAVATRIDRMETEMENVTLVIQDDWSIDEIYDLAEATHGGNYRGNPGPFYWSNRKARNTIRHQLTNYEDQWRRINRGPTAEFAYTTLRERIDELVDETYPQFACGMPEADPR